MQRLLLTSTLVLLLAGLVSCERGKSKSKQLRDEVRQKAANELREQTQKVTEKVFPPFDHDQPDTENNKQRFRDFIGLTITPDIHNIYCYDDAVGIDAFYLFAFNCNEATSQKIIKQLELGIDSSGINGPQRDFDWWDLETEAAEKYSSIQDHAYYRLYWYDKKKSKAYYSEFSI